MMSGIAKSGIVVWESVAMGDYCDLGEYCVGSVLRYECLAVWECIEHFKKSILIGYYETFNRNTATNCHLLAGD